MVWAKEFAVIKASEIGIVRNSLAECLTWKFLYAEFGRVSLPEGEGQSNFVRVCWWCSLNKLLILVIPTMSAAKRRNLLLADGFVVLSAGQTGRSPIF